MTDYSTPNGGINRTASASRRILAGLVMLAALLVVGTVPAQDEVFYSTHDLEILVPFSAGGSTDTWSRFLARYLPDYVQGSPTVTIENKPGAGALLGMNEYAQITPHDGTTLLGSSTSNAFTYRIGHPEVRFDFADFIPLFVTGESYIVYASPSTGIESISDLQREDGPPLYYGLVGPLDAGIRTVLEFDMLGLDVKLIVGYGGGGSRRAAFESGELNMDYQTSSAYVSNVEPLVQEGRAVPLWQTGVRNEAGAYERSPLFPEIPTFVEVHEELYGESPSGELREAWEFVMSTTAVSNALWIHDDAPSAAIEALQDALAEMGNDAEFLAEARELGIIGNTPFNVGEDAAAQVTSLTDASPERISWLIEYTTDNLGAPPY